MLLIYSPRGKAPEKAFDVLISYPSRHVEEKALRHGASFVPLIDVRDVVTSADAMIVTASGRHGESPCPLASLPLIIEALKKAVEECTPKAVAISGLWYPSPSAREDFYSCFCTKCSDRGRELGLAPDALAKQLVSATRVPYPVDAVHAISSLALLRSKIVEYCLAEISSKARDAGVEVWFVAPPPSIAWLMGVDYCYIAKHASTVLVMLADVPGAPSITASAMMSAVLWGRRAPQMLLGLGHGARSGVDYRQEALEAYDVLGDRMVPLFYGEIPEYALMFERKGVIVL